MSPAPSSGPLARRDALDRVRALRQRALDERDAATAGLDAVGGRTLAEPVTAPRAVPPHDYATMDGYAFATADAEGGAWLVITDSVAPEDDPPELAPGEAVRIATGAPLPARADAVVKQEHAAVDADAVPDAGVGADVDIDDDAAGARLSAPALPAGTHVHPAGTTASEGEELFAAGDRLAPRHAALLRDVGVERVTVHRRFSVGVLATGTEIHEGRQPDRDSDFLVGLLRRWGHDPTVLEAVPDDEATVRTAIEDAATDFAAVVTTGGTSVGGADHVASVLHRHDVSFAGVALRPGRPVAAATVAGTPVFALPGKPLAAHTAFVLVVAPFFAGDRPLATVPATPSVRVGLPDRADAHEPTEYAIPVVLDGDRAVPLGHDSSSLGLYSERFRPGRVSASTRTTLADGLAVTDVPLDPAASVAVVPYPVVE